MAGAGLEPTFGRYVEGVPAVTLAAVNAMSLLGLHRRLRGAVAGHLAAFEMTSSLPSRRYGDGFRRNGFGTDVTEYFDELSHGPGRDYFRPNVWPNTPDILPVSLQQGVRAAFMARVTLAATLAANYGI